jgi:hypothetical protein
MTTAFLPARRPQLGDHVRNDDPGEVYGSARREQRLAKREHEPSYGLIVEYRHL